MLKLASANRQSIESCLSALREDTGCEAVLLLDQNGELIAAQGDHDQQDVVRLGTLIAGTFASSREMARLTSDRDEVQVIFQQGERANTLFMLIKGRWILVLIMQSSQPLGAVKVRSRQTVAELERLLIDLEKSKPAKQANRAHQQRNGNISNDAWPRASGYAQRLAHLRVLLTTDFADAGDQALKLLESYLEELARNAGFGDGTGGMGRYVAYLRSHELLNQDLLGRAETYTQARNCLAHTYGLQTTPALAEEVISFIGTLLRQAATTAARIMSSHLHSIDHHKPLTAARDLMLREGLGRLPVLRDGHTLVGLLTERDIVVAEADAERRGGSIEGVKVQDALPADSRQRLATIGADASYEAVVDALRTPGVQALLVTRDGGANRPLGIITHADLLYRL